MGVILFWLKNVDDILLCISKIIIEFVRLLISLCHHEDIDVYVIGDGEMSSKLSDTQRNIIKSILTSIIMRIYEARELIDIESYEIDYIYDSHSKKNNSLEMNLRHYQIDPIGTGLRHAIKDVGTIIFPYASLDELIWVAEEASKKSGCVDFSLAIFSRMWDGLVSADGRRWTA